MNKLEQGINSYLSGDTNTAIKLLELCLDKNPNSQAYYYLGLANTDLGKNKEAAVYFHKALDMEPNNGTYNYQLGLIYYQLMLLQQAIEHLSKTIEQNPEHVRAHFILGNVYFKKGDLNNAIDLYKKVIEKSPYFAPAYYELGNSYYYKGESDKANDYFLKALELNENPDTLAKIAIIALERSELKKGAGYMIKSLDKGFDNITQLSAFISLLHEKSVENAEEFIQLIKKQFPDISENIIQIKKYEL